MCGTVNTSVSSHGDITECKYTEHALNKESMNTDYNIMDVESTRETYQYTKDENSDRTEPITQ